MTGRSNTINIGVVGAGKRAASYFSHIPEDLKPAVRLTALVDPNPRNRASFTSLFGSDFAVGEYADAEEMLRQADLDAVILAPPNIFHARAAELAISRGLHILLEKPVAITAEECRTLWRASQSASRPASVTVGFVLRYTPFYAKVKELISAGAIGSVLAIDADENLGTDLTNLFHKGWRRDNELAGGFMVEKCCHDFDILNWLASAPVERAFSMAKRTHLVPQPAGGRHSRFDVAGDRRVDDADFGDHEISEAFYTPMKGSPYDFPTEQPDHQAVILEYEGGALASFMACMGQPRTNRRLRVFGTDGSLEGDIAESEIVVHKPHAKGNGWEVSRHHVIAEAGNHHGGDAVLGHAFWRLAAGEQAETKAGLRDGIEAVLVALAAQESSVTHQQVNVGIVRNHVFGAISPF